MTTTTTPQQQTYPLPKGYDDKRSPYFVPEDLRAAYARHDHSAQTLALQHDRSGSLAWTNYSGSQERVAEAKLRRDGYISYAESQQGVSGRVWSVHEFQQTLSRLKVQDYAEHAHRQILVLARRQVASDQKRAAEARAEQERKTCQVCGSVDKTTSAYKHGLEGTRVCDPCQETIGRELAARQDAERVPNAATRRAAVGKWLDAR